MFKTHPKIAIRNHAGFALVVTLSLMILLAVISVGLLGLAAVELRKSNAQDARSTAMANARLGLMLALGQLQKDLGDDRRISADASVLTNTQNPYAVGVWNGWSPDLASKTGSGTTARVDYRAPKSQTGFRSWLASSADPDAVRQLAWHSSPPAGSVAHLFTKTSSGFDLSSTKIPVSHNKQPGTVAWAVTQENTKARINVSADDALRISQDDRLQAPARPNLANSVILKQPSDNDWLRRSATVCRLTQATLDPAFGADRNGFSAASKDYTAESYSLLTNPVRGGVKYDLTTGFELRDTDFAKDSWSDSWGKVSNPFRSTAISQYNGQKALYRPVTNSAQATVQMNFPPASVNHKFNVNGVPTFDMLRSHYRMYRHLYTTPGSGDTAFERPYSHVAIPAADRVSGRPFGVKTQPGLNPVLDRVNMVFSIYAKSDGTLCILLSPFITLWNPYNVAIETEGLVVYPWIDLAVYWNWNVTAKSGSNPSAINEVSLSRFVGEGYMDGNTAHGRSSRPYFYLHLTQTGASVNSGTRTINPAIRLEPGEVRVFCLADAARRDLETQQGSATRTWRMKAVQNATDLINGKNGGIVLNMTKSIGKTNNFNYKLQSGDTVNANSVSFDRNTYFYIMNMADSWQIKNPNTELMVETRPAQGGFQMLPAEKNLVFYDQIHSGTAFGRGRDTFQYPAMPFDLINEKPQMVGSILTYHRTALASGKPVSDLMFTTNPRQPYVTQYLGAGGKFQTGPHYESLMQGGTTLSALTMETSTDGRNAYYGPTHSANALNQNRGRSFLPFFEVPRSPLLSLAAFQHCDLSASAFGCPSQVGNSWASPYLSSAAVVSRLPSVSDQNGVQTPINPMLGVYDVSYLSNEALFDDCYLSGAAPVTGAPKSATGSTDIWNSDQITETRSSDDVLKSFFQNPGAAPLRNPRMQPYYGTRSPEQVVERLGTPAKCVRLASNLMIDGGFNINSTSEEAWTAVLSSLRGVEPSTGNKTPQSRFRNILTNAPINMAEDDPWSGFRSLSDGDIKLLAKNIVAEIKLRGPFLSLGEFVNRRVSSDRGLNLSGAIQTAIDKSGFNKKFTYGTIDTSLYPNPENLPTPNTGTNTPGWLSQADVLHALAPCMAARSDTFIIRALGEAKAPNGDVLASVQLEAVVQRVPDWVDPKDDPALPVADLTSNVNKTFGRRFEVVSVRELTSSSGNPI